MSLQLNIYTGEFREWKPSYENETEDSHLKESCIFLDYKLRDNEDDFRIYSLSKHKLYVTDHEKNVFQEKKVQFDVKELECNEPGFCKYSESLPYDCIGSAKICNKRKIS